MALRSASRARPAFTSAVMVASLSLSAIFSPVSLTASLVWCTASLASVLADAAAHHIRTRLGGKAKVVFACRTSRVVHEALLSPEPQLVDLVRPAFLATVFAPDQPEGHGVESQGEIVRELRRIASEDDPGLMTKEETR